MKLNFLYTMLAAFGDQPLLEEPKRRPKVPVPQHIQQRLIDAAEAKRERRRLRNIRNQKRIEK